MMKKFPYQAPYNYTKFFPFSRSAEVNMTVGTPLNYNFEANFTDLPAGGFWLVGYHWFPRIRDDAVTDEYINIYDPRVNIWVEVDDYASGLPFGDLQNGVSVTGANLNQEMYTQGIFQMDYSMFPVYFQGFQCRVKFFTVVSNFAPVGTLKFKFGGWVALGFKDDPDEYILTRE